MQLKYKTVMMTGGSSGIGRATVLMLAKEGARVLLCDVNEAGAQETIKMAGSGAVDFIKVELTDGGSVDACAKEALKRAGLGASRMYPNVLPDMPAVAEIVSGRPCAAARDFCQRLITLPSHSRVRRAHLARLAAIVAPTKAAAHAIVDSSNAVH